MKCKLPNQETGSSAILLGPMSKEYDPPGKEVKQDDSGVKYIDVIEDIGEKLIENYDFTEYSDENEDNDYEVSNDDTN